MPQLQVFVAFVCVMVGNNMDCNREIDKAVQFRTAEQCVLYVTRLNRRNEVTGDRSRFSLCFKGTISEWNPLPVD
jgi:hypothetical protein